MKLILATAALATSSPELPNKFLSLRKLSICQDFKKQQRLAALEFKKFTQKYGLPPTVQSEIQTLKNSDATNKPMLISKGCDLTQVINAQRLKNYIKNNNLNLLSVSAHYITRIHNQWSVVAKPIEPQHLNLPYAPINQLVRQLATLSLGTGFTHMIKLSNWVYSQNKIVFTTTHSELFEKGENIQEQSIGKFTQQIMHYALEQGIYGEILTEKEDIPYKKIIRNLPSIPPLSRNYKLDDSDIDIQKVEQHLDYLGLRKNCSSYWNDCSNRGISKN